MPREIDERKKRKALRKLRKAADLAAQGLGPELSDWEKQFLEEVEQRIETYGSAFVDPEKGAPDEAMSALQHLKLREIDKKARGKGKSGFKPRKPIRSNTRQIDADIEPPPEKAPQAKPAPPKLVKASDMATPEPSPAPVPAARPKGPPTLRVIKGGADDT